MSDKDVFRDLFSEKLGNYEAKVNPELWNSISSKLVTSAVTSTSVGTSLLAKLLIGGSISAAALIGGYFIFNTEENREDKTINTAQDATGQKWIDTKQDVQAKDNRQLEVKKDNSVFIPSSKKDNEKIISTTLPSNTVTVNTQNIIEKTMLPERNELIQVQPVIIDVQKEELVVKAPVKEEKLIIQKESQVIDEPILDSNLPNVFTPNGDGENDLFFIKSKGLNDFSIVIMNSKNTVVFKSNDPDFVWDGIGLNGEAVDDGQYLYYLTSYDKNGKAVNKYKALTIKRK